ncbi:PaaI family thioesterase [Nocardioides sp. LML1-1-1.1]
MIGSLRSFLDNLAAARTGPNDIAEVERALGELSRRLAAHAVPVSQRPYGRWSGSRNRGQALVPDIEITEQGHSHIEATVRFGEFYMGENGAVHGGAIPLLFDELLGHISFAGGRVPSRTAYLRTDFRSITPVGVDLVARGWYEREEGRKRFIRGSLHHRGVLCVDAEGLFVELRAGQP